MVVKKMTTRDYLRTFITRANKAVGVNFNSSKLNSKEECEEYLLNLIKNLKNNSTLKNFKNTEKKILEERERSFKFKLESIKCSKKLTITKSLLSVFGAFIIIEFIIILCILK